MISTRHTQQKTATSTRREPFQGNLQHTETSAAQEDWQAIMLLRVTNTVCINPLAIITSRLIDIPLLCSLKTVFDWLFWKTLPYQHGTGKASFCSSCSQEWTLAIWSPGPLSALLCFAEDFWTLILPCVPAPRARGCEVLCATHTSELYRVTGKPNVSKSGL